jgi:hypothetical protein
MKVYKLTTQDNTTHNDFKWIVGEWAPELSGKDGLCSNTMYHWYHDPLLAVLLNSIHANLKEPILWEAEAAGTIMDDKRLKGGSTTMCIVKQMELPIVSTTQRVAFAILCALEACQDAEFVKWATNWLSGEDRTYEAADAAYAAAYAAANTANAAARAVARAAAYAVTDAADAAAYAVAYAAAYAVAYAAANAANAADAAADAAAYAAANAADAAAYAAANAANAVAYAAAHAAAYAVARTAEASKINLVKLAHIAHETY